MNDFDDNSLEEKEESAPLDLNIIKATLAQNGYSFLRPIGKGGFSSVFLVFSNHYSLEFVVKVSNYKRSHKNQPKESDEFDLTEINHLINLNHPNIINMYKYFTDDQYLYVILEYCQGGSLKDLIQKGGRIRSANLYNYCYQILIALKHCHDLKIAHNDIKPANVLIDKNQRLKLADFGLSKGFSSTLFYANNSNMPNQSDHSIGQNGQILIKRFGGSRPYMAPELLNYTAYDPFKADIWSLGVTFYELATGHLPWSTTDFKQMRLQISVGIFSFGNTKLPGQFCKIIHKMLDVTPLKRPTIEWLLEQSIFSQSTAGNSKVRTSIINRSSSIGNLQLSRMRSSDRIRNSMSLFSSNSDVKPSNSSPIASMSDNENHESDMYNDYKSNQVPFSLLKPQDEQNHYNDAHDVQNDNNDNEEYIAVQRKNVRRNIKMARSSLPVTKTFF